MCERCEDLTDALRRIAEWADAYPESVFREPKTEDYQRAHELLTANGMSIDMFSAAMGRHCLKGVARIARDALQSEGMYSK